MTSPTSPLNEINPANMSAEEIDAAIAELRQRQLLSASVQVSHKTLWDIMARVYSNIGDRHGMRSSSFWTPSIRISSGHERLSDAYFSNFWEPSVSKPITENWAQDTANLRGDMERIGRDMWIGVLQHSKSNR